MKLKVRLGRQNSDFSSRSQKVREKKGGGFSRHPAAGKFFTYKINSVFFSPKWVKNFTRDFGRVKFFTREFFRGEIFSSKGCIFSFVEIFHTNRMKFYQQIVMLSENFTTQFSRPKFAQSFSTLIFSTGSSNLNITNLQFKNANTRKYIERIMQKFNYLSTSSAYFP